MRFRERRKIALNTRERKIEERRGDRKIGGDTITEEKEENIQEDGLIQDTAKIRERHKEEGRKIKKGGGMKRKTERIIDTDKESG